MKHIPNFITSLNLASGFIAIILAVNGNLTAASWLLVAAMIFDFCDGFAARLLKAYSETGRELDSLADIVSFGVAPAVIIYKLVNNSFSSGITWISRNIFRCIQGIFMSCSGYNAGLRSAASRKIQHRFNPDGLIQRTAHTC